MKNLFLLTASILLFTACERNSTSNEREAPLKELNGEKIISKYSEKLQKIFVSDKGVIRGVSLGDKISNIHGLLDTANLIMKPAEGKFKYVCPLNTYEDVDLIFFFNNDEIITEIGIDPFLNNQQSVDSLSREMINYFTDKYGKIFTSKGKITNGRNKRIHIVIEDVSIKTVPGLQVRITK